MLDPALVFDFDNTLTRGDVLDEVIAQFSPDEGWKHWEAAWVAGDLSARDCLRRQMEGLRVTREDLLAYLGTVRIDPAFARIQDWCRAKRADLIIVSDSFAPLIEHILACNAIAGVPVFANELAFAGDRLVPSFPYFDPAVPRSANAKARHLAAYRHHTIVFAGDGRSDLDAALVSDVVFAKDTLARELDARSIDFRPFDTLEPVLAFLESTESDRLDEHKAAHD